MLQRKVFSNRQRIEDMAAPTSAFRPDKENVVYVGAGATLKGQITVPDIIVVDGAVDGDVIARTVVVGESGVIRGTIAATEADVGGLVASHVEIEQLLIVRATGRVEGRVIYGEIELEKGATVTGDLSVKTTQRAAGKPVAALRIAAPERQDALAVADMTSKAGGGSIDRLNEAVRVAKGGAVKVAAPKDMAAQTEPATNEAAVKDEGAATPPPKVASDAETRRRNILRLPLSSRRASV
jgi:cytoskeletal protein CcmA (bactofilin family)